MKKTKIICTLGPASENINIMRQMVQKGMNVARLNFSHGNYEEHGARMATVRQLRSELNCPISLLLDTKGPEIRTGRFENDAKVTINEGQTFTLYADNKMGTNEGCSVSFNTLYKYVKEGTRILAADGLVAFKVTAIKGTDIVCTAENSGTLGNNKNMNVPGVSVPIPFLAEKDVLDIKFGIEQGVDYIAASFTRTAEDVLAIRKLLKEGGKENIQIICKIENHEGINNFDAILAAADGIMVARGDLGVEIPQEQVPINQREMIKKTRKAGKIIITATQMLDSMERNPRPTRAEVSDVSNAVYFGSTAVMLSGESAAGKYPVESVQTMAEIAESTENSLDYWNDFFNYPHDTNMEQSPALGRAACDLAASLNVKAILVLTQSGNSARAIARHRPACPIYARTPLEDIKNQLALYWGVTAFVSADKPDFQDNVRLAIETATKNGYLSAGDLIVVVAGVPAGKPRSATNFIKVHRVGEGIL